LPKVRLALLIAAVLGVTACGHDPKQLDRVLVKRLLIAAAAHSQLTTDLIVGESSPADRATVSFGQSDGGDTPAGNALVKSGVLSLRYFNTCPTIDDCYQAKYLLTPAGRHIASAWRVRKKTATQTDYVVPVGEEKIDAVTGIQSLDTSHAEASFDCTASPNDIGEKLIALLPPIAASGPFGNISFHSRPQHCSVDLTLYDDGWRIDP
jgi:hypothetical protein